MVNAANAYHRRRVPNFYRDAIEAAYGIGTAKELPSQEYGMFSPEERKAFMAQYEDGNARVARRFLHREDGVLFYEKQRELPQWKPDRKELDEDVVRVLSGADVYLYRQQEDIGERLQRLEDGVREAHEGIVMRLYRRLRELPKRFNARE